MISRRALLTCAGACAAVAGCDRRGAFERAAATEAQERDTATDTEGSACVDTGAATSGWVELALADYTALRTVGGYVYVVLPEHLLNVVIAMIAEDCYVAVWRICSHGACETDWDAATDTAICPCHGSVFAEDGAVLVGPATAGLRTFPVVRRGDSLWLDRTGG